MTIIRSHILWRGRYLTLELVATSVTNAHPVYTRGKDECVCVWGPSTTLGLWLTARNMGLSDSETWCKLSSGKILLTKYTSRMTQRWTSKYRKPGRPELQQQGLVFVVFVVAILWPGNATLIYILKRLLSKLTTLAEIIVHHAGNIASYAICNCSPDRDWPLDY